MDRKTPWTSGPWAWVEEEADDVEWGPVWSLGPGVLLVDGSDGTPDGDEIDQANARLIAQSPRMAEAMQWFCDRVDAGEVRSTKTYNLFKDILSDVYGEGA